MVQSDLLTVFRESHTAMFQLKTVSCGYKHCCVYSY